MFSHANGYFVNLSLLQIRAGQQSITANFWPLTAHIYVMIIVTCDFSEKKFLLLFFPRNSFEQS